MTTQAASTPSADVSGASFGSYLNYSQAWYALTQAQRDAFEAALPFARSSARELGITGYLQSDRTYSSGGRALDRLTVRSY